MKYPDKFSEDTRYVFTNWSDEDFEGQWGGVKEMIRKDDTIELPEFKAYHYCRHFVDREMRKAGQNNSRGIDDARKPFEDKTIAVIGAGVDSPALSKLKAQIRAEVQKEAVSKGDTVAPEEQEPAGKKEFATLKRK